MHLLIQVLGTALILWLLAVLLPFIASVIIPLMLIVPVIASTLGLIRTLYGAFHDKD